MRLTLVAALSLMLAACGVGGESEEGSEATVPDTTAPDTTALDTTAPDTVTTYPGADRGSPGAERAPTSSEAGTGEVPDEVMDQIVADLQQRIDADLAELEITRAEQVTWPDGSLGCPQPGTFYTQALVDGYHVELVVGGQSYDYRIGASGDIRLCETPARP